MADLGERVLDRLYNLSQIDAKWSVRTEHGFSWWAGDLAQHVWEDSPIQSNGHQLTRVHVRTDLVYGFKGTERQLQVLGLLARHATLSGWVRDPEDPSRIQFAAAASVHEGAFDFLTHLLSLAGAIQVAEAHILIPMLEAVEDWTVARSAHPTSGHRQDPDNMLQVVEGLPLREAPSRWEGSEMLDVLRILKGPPSILANGDESGIAAEFSFPGPRGSSLLRISTREQHPRLGHGCLFRLTLPPSETALTSMSDLLEANEREAESQNYFLGSWCPAEEGPTYVSFLPNAAYQPGALQSLAMSLVNRARWVTAEFFDHDIDENYEEAAARKAAELGALSEPHAGRPGTREPIDSGSDPSEPADVAGAPDELSMKDFLDSRKEQLRDKRTFIVQREVSDQLGRASLPLAGLLLIGILFGLSRGFGSSAAWSLYGGALTSAAAMFFYALPSVLISTGRKKKGWMALAAAGGMIPFLYAIYVMIVPGVIGLFDQSSIWVSNFIIILLGYWYLRQFDRLTELTKKINALIQRTGG